jgi:hypothetical protein
MSTISMLNGITRGKATCCCLPTTVWPWHINRRLSQRFGILSRRRVCTVINLGTFSEASEVRNEAANCFAGDSPEDLVQRLLLSLERVRPYRGPTRAIDDFKNPTLLVLATIDLHVDGRPILSDFLAQ